MLPSGLCRVQKGLAVSKLSSSLRPVLLATLSMTVALSGCAAGGLGMKKSSNGGGAAPKMAAASAEDPMLAAPPATMEGNGSQRVPLGQLASNAQTAPSAPVPAGNGPVMLVPPPSAGSTVDPMAAPPPPSVVAAAKPTPAPTPAPAPTPTPAPAMTAPKVVEAAPGVLTAAPQPETLAKMAKAAPAKATAAKAEPSNPEPAKVEVAKAEPPKAEMPIASKAATAASAPRVDSNLDLTRGLGGPAASTASPQMKLTIPPKGSRPMPSDQGDTVVISSANTLPVRDTREFIPAMVASNTTPMLAMAGMPSAKDAPGGMTSRPLSAAEKNVAQRFEVLKLLLDQGLITPEEYARHRGSNVGALLPYSHEPGAVGLERPVPSGDALVARLEALRRSLEVRAISAKQHAMERSMIINALLPDAPTDRMNQMPPPEDVMQAATMISHLQTLRSRNLVSSEEFDREKRAVEQALRTGTSNPQAVAKGDAGPAKAPAAAKKVDAAAKAEADAAAAADELTAPVPGPVLHLASFRSQDAAKKAWADALDHNKTLLGQVKPVIRRIDLGPERGVFYRLMAGPYTSLAAAETACQALKQNNQFCRASADGS